MAILVPKIINIELDLLQLFKHTLAVRFLDTVGIT